MRTVLLSGRLFAVAFAAAVAGCALNPPPTASDLQAQALPHTMVPAAWKAGGGAAVPVADRWLASFDDPALSALVDEALVYNADLQVAAARVEQAAGYVKVASGALLPSVGVLAMGGGKSGGSGGLDGVWLNASLELDVWGRLRYGRAAAEEQSAAVAADYAYARQSLAATVAKSWFVAIEAGLQRANRAGCAACRRGLAARGAGTAACRQRQRAGGRGSAASTSAPLATACARSSSRASRRCVRWSSSSDAIRRRRSPSRTGFRGCRRRCRSACRRSSSSGGPTSSPPSVASRRRSTGSAKPVPRSCRGSA